MLVVATNQKNKKEISKKIEDRINILFTGLLRKDGSTPMAMHSIRVGQDLVNQDESLEVIFSGYYHDVPEDVEPYSKMSKSEIINWLFNEAITVGLTSEQAQEAVITTLECIYQQNELDAEKAIGGREGKKKRKALACERWGNADRKVMAVKSADIRDNKKDCLKMSETFIKDYSDWADPLYEKMQKSLKK